MQEVIRRAAGACAASEPVGEDELDQAGDPVGIKLFIADFVAAVFSSRVVAPVGPGAVEVGESVFAGKGPGAEHAAGFFHGAGIGGEGDDGAADVAGRFGDEEILGRVILIGGIRAGIFAFAGVFPVGFGNAEMIEDGFGAQEARSERDGDDVAFTEFASHGERQADDRDFHKVVEKIATVVKSISIGNFENNGTGIAASGALRFGATQHQRNGEMGRDDVGVDGLLEQAETVIEVDVPERFAEFSESVAAPNVVDKNVQAMVAALDERDQFFYLCRIDVIDAHRNAAASSGSDEFGGFFDGLGAAMSGAMFASAAARAVNGGAGFTECDGNATSSTTSSSSNKSDFALQRFVGRFLRHGVATSAVADGNSWKCGKHLFDLFDFPGASR